MGTREVWTESATQCLWLLSFDINSLGINNFKALFRWIRAPFFPMYHFDFLLVYVSELSPSSLSDSDVGCGEIHLLVIMDFIKLCRMLSKVTFFTFGKKVFHGYLLCYAV